MIKLPINLSPITRIAMGLVALAGSIILLTATLFAVMPDNRCRDLDNLLKATLDALTCAGVWDDDSQIHDLRITRGKKGEAGGMMIVMIAVHKEPLFDETKALEAGGLSSLAVRRVQR